MLLWRSKRLRQIAGFLETASFLSLKLMWKRPDKGRRFPGIVFRDYMALVGQERWRSQRIFELFPELKEKPQRIVLEHFPSFGIQNALDALGYLALICVAIRPKTVFEFGTFRGRTALNFALNTPDGCRVFTLDIPKGDRDERMSQVNAADRWIMAQSETGIDYQGRDVTHKIEQLFGDSQSFDFRPFFGQIDLVFVDGGHDYEVARSDTRNALEMLSPGGVIVWDEFANYGDYHDVTRAVLDELSADEVVQIANSELAVYRKPAA
ncbi:MAG TPA: class I SAM-dependent methyltransferase [Myxococcota bacterium]|jgi:predicted O-methyltransferase YrrM|nr:class I SAM-dependent methyltransferase [Myxococcota bacterium]